MDGLPLFGGSQLAVDTTLVCSLHSDGSPHRGAADTDGVVFPRARKRKELRYPELVGPGSRARLVVLALEVGGRWSPETRTFVAQLAKAKARRGAPRPSRLGECGGVQSSRAHQGRPSQHVSWASGAHMGLTDTPLIWEVEADHRHAVLAA